jgi:hypothetical protein
MYVIYSIYAGHVIVLLTLGFLCGSSNAGSSKNQPASMPLVPSAWLQAN